MAIPVMKLPVWGCKISTYLELWQALKNYNSNTVPSLYCTWHFMCVELKN